MCIIIFGQINNIVIVIVIEVVVKVDDWWDYNSMIQNIVWAKSQIKINV